LRKFLLTLLLLVLLPFNAILPQRSGNFKITHYNIGSGLATNKIHHATQDSINRMWFATGYGVSIYDGFKWENIHLLDNQNHSGFKKIIIDDLNHKWLVPVISTHRFKVNKDDGWADEKISLGSPLEPEFITDAAVKVSGGNTMVVVATEKSLFASFNGKWSELNGGGETYLSVETFGDTFYLAGSEGLSKLSFTKTGGVSITHQLYGINSRLLAIKEVASPPAVPRLLVLATGWIGEIKDGNLKKFDVEVKVDVSPTQQFYYITEDLNGNIFFGNKYLNFYYNTVSGEFTPARKENGFTSEGATSVYVDTEGNVWICDLRGIDKITYHPFHNYYQKDGLLEDEVTAAIEYSPGNFIFGHNTGYTVFSNGKFKAVSFLRQTAEEFQASRVLDLELDNSGNIWAACGYFGIVKIDPSGAFTRVAKTRRPATSVLWDHTLGLIVATEEDIYTLKGNELQLLNPEFKKTNFRKLFRFNNKLYAASSLGLFQIEKTGITNLISGEDKLTSNVFSLLALDKDSLLVGTEAGLFLLHKGRMLKVLKDGFSISKSVYFVIRSRSGYLWFGTADGLIKWDGASSFNEYIVQDGLAGYEINRSAVLIDSRNILWVGTNSGISSYRLGRKENRVAPPKVWLAGFETSAGEMLNLTQENFVSNAGNSLIFTFRGVSFVNEELIRYKVKLEGFDNDFYEISQSQLQNVRYLNLPSGAYRLVVMAKNRFSEWSDPVYSGVILIEKPFYYQTWFIALLFTFVVTLFLIGNKFYFTTRAQAQLEKMVQERTKALAESEKKLKNTLDGLEEEVRQHTAELEASNKTKDKIFSIISHDLRSPFMSILGYSELLNDEHENLDTPTVRKYTERIMEASQNTMSMVDGLLEWSKLQMGGVVPVHEEVELASIVHETGRLYNPQITKKGQALIIDIDENLKPVTDPAIIRTVIRNLVTNAIKFTPHGGMIKVSAREARGHVEIDVADTGIGIPEDMIATLFTMDSVQSRKGTASEKGTGLGLSLVHDLLMKVGGEISVESTVGSGTVFRVVLPLNTATDGTQF